MPDWGDNEAQRKELGDRIDRTRRAQRMTLAALAVKAGYDERTIRYVIQGRPSKSRTISEICAALGIQDRVNSVETAEVTDDIHGGYSKKSFNIYMGHYAAFRWSYDLSGSIIRSRFDIAWSAEKNCAVFTENQIYRDATSSRIIDFSQDGEIYASDIAGLIHLMTITAGMVRVITLTKMQLPDPHLKGAVLTQARMTFYRRPAVSPILLRKLSDVPSTVEMDALVGEILPGKPEYNEVAAELRAVEREVLLSTIGGPHQQLKKKTGSSVYNEKVTRIFPAAGSPVVSTGSD